MQSQHRYSEVNTLLARAEQEIKGVMDGTLHAEFNALRAGRHQRRQSRRGRAAGETGAG